jgi:glycosyltransferase involved in cell wall biosynthesis
MNRILILDQFSEIGGAQRCLLDLLPGLHSRRWQVHVALPADGPFSAALAGGGAQVWTLPCGPFSMGRKTARDSIRFLAQWPRQVLDLRVLLRHIRPHVLYVNGPRLLPVAALCRRRTPLVFHCHSVVTQPLANRLVRASLLAARANIIASSRFAARAWADFSPTVIYNGVDGPETVLPAARGPLRTIGVVGRIAPEKGQLDFVRAARIAAPHLPEVRFLIVGAPVFAAPNYFHQVRSEAAGLPIEFREWAPDASAALRDLDLLVVPSADSDANPRVIPEAFARGIAVVAYRGGGIAELVEDGLTGVLVNTRTTEALAAALVRVIRNPGLASAMTVRARAAWEDRFRPGAFQAGICDMLDSLLERRHHRAPLANVGISAAR